MDWSPGGWMGLRVEVYGCLYSECWMYIWWIIGILFFKLDMKWKFVVNASYWSYCERFIHAYVPFLFFYFFVTYVIISIFLWNLQSCNPVPFCTVDCKLPFSPRFFFFLLKICFTQMYVTTQNSLWLTFLRPIHTKQKFSAINILISIQGCYWLLKTNCMCKSDQMFVPNIHVVVKSPQNYVKFSFVIQVNIL